jgi:hypothetical protein
MHLLNFTQDAAASTAVPPMSASEAFENLTAVRENRKSTPPQIGEAARIAANRLAKDPNALQELTLKERLGMTIMQAVPKTGSKKEIKRQIELIAKTLEQNSDEKVSAALNNLLISQKPDFNDAISAVKGLLGRAENFRLNSEINPTDKMKREFSRARMVRQEFKIIKESFAKLNVKLPDDLSTSVDTFIKNQNKENRDNLVDNLESVIKRFDVAVNREIVQDELIEEYKVAHRCLLGIIVPPETVYKITPDMVQSRDRGHNLQTA